MTNDRKRTILGAIVAVALLATLARAALGLPKYGESRGPVERERAIASVSSSHATNLDAFVNFDYRAFDTLGEEFIFLAGIAGFTLILRERRGEISDEAQAPLEGRAPRDREIELSIVTRAYVPVSIAYGLYVIAHGQLTPGGGFQGGAALATGLLAVALGIGFTAFRKATPKEPVETLEALGTLAYPAIGLAAVATSGIFLKNAFPHGDTGALLSGGSILLLNDGVGIAVAAGFIVLFDEFLSEMREART